MIRFQPDTWRDALLRPLAIAAPDNGVYIEIMAPDFRFVYAAALLVLLAALLYRRGGAAARPVRAVLVLAAALGVALVPWMATTGNGRYFIAGLLAAGPLCIALVWALPMTRGFRLTLAIGLVAWQAFAVQQSNPWNAWTLARWQEAPYFGIDLPPDMATQPATYVTMSNISYSLLGPLFPPQSRWMSLANAPTPESGSPDSSRVQRFLAEAPAGRLVLLVPVIPGSLRADGAPGEEVAGAIAGQLGRHRLAFTQPRACRLLRSRGLASMALRKEYRQDERYAMNFAFWACQLQYRPAAAPAPNRHAGRFDAVFDQLERQCPRFFDPGHPTSEIPAGVMRSYSDGEMKTYVLDSGEVFYKYYRALNPVRIGRVDEVLRGVAKMECSKIRGRSGLPWEREI